MIANLTNVPEYVILDSILLKHENNESIRKVQSVLADFHKHKDKALPLLNRNHIQALEAEDLKTLFDHTLSLAEGRESNFVYKHYKTIFIQLAFQLGFLLERVFPDSPYAKHAKSKLTWLSTMDVKLETKLLKPFFEQNIRVLDTPPPIADTILSREVYYWDLDEIAYILANISIIGFEFKRFMDMY